MKNLGSFLREVKSELSKVVWPSKEEFVGSIIVVVLVLIVFTIFFGIVNYLFQKSALKAFQYLAYGRV